MGEETLKDKILQEMVVDYKNSLERNFTLAKKLIKITPEGKVEILFREKLAGKEQILLYLIGRLYAKEAGFVETENVTNKELMEELDKPKGSILPWIKDLRDSGKIKQTDSDMHIIPINLVGKILKDVLQKAGVDDSDGN